MQLLLCTTRAVVVACNLQHCNFEAGGGAGLYHVSPCGVTVFSKNVERVLCTLVLTLSVYGPNNAVC